MSTNKFRVIPSVEQLRQRDAVRLLEVRFGHEVVVDALREEAASVRTHLIENSPVDDDVDREDILRQIENGLEKRLCAMLRPSLRRVINATGKLRHSVAFLVATRSDVVVECIPSCQGPDNPAKYEPSNYADYIAAIRKMNYDIGEADAAE